MNRARPFWAIPFLIGGLWSTLAAARERSRGALPSEVSMDSPASSKRNTPTPGLSRSFADRYPDPVLSVPEPSPVPGLALVRVFDKSELNQDPILPSAWLKFRDGRMFEADAAGFRDALAAAGHAPSSGEEAVALARLYVRARANSLRHVHVLDRAAPVEPFALKPPPDLGTLGVAPPSVESVELRVCRPRGPKESDRLLIPAFRVTLCVQDLSGGAWGMRREEWVYRLTLTVGEGTFDVAQETLWPMPETVRLRPDPATP